MGNLDDDKPQGTLNPGTPAIRSDRKRRQVHCQRIIDLSPIAKAGVGDVGVIIASHCLKAVRRSFLMRVRTCWAFR